MKTTLIILFVIIPFGLIIPDTLSHCRTCIPWLLGLIMFSMGASLSTSDILDALKSWKLVILGVILQFTLMPFLAWSSGYVLGWESPLFIGMLLVGCSPGGTASNVIVYLGKGNVSMSILMTVCSTALSPILTPLLLKLLGGVVIEFDSLKMFYSILIVVILPVVLGLVIVKILPQITSSLKKIGPIVSSAAIALIIAIVIALNYETIMNGFPMLCFAVVVGHNLLGYAITYLLVFRLSKDKTNAFTLATEVAMQNSGLAVNLARQFFVNIPITALPGAIFSLWHNISGLTLAFLSSQKVNR